MKAAICARRLGPRRREVRGVGGGPDNVWVTVQRQYSGLIPGTIMDWTPMLTVQNMADWHYYPGDTQLMCTQSTYVLCPPHW